MAKKNAFFQAILPCALCLFVLVPACRAEDGAIAVVVHKQNSIINISLRDLRNVYLGDQRFWKGQLVIIPLMRVGGSRERAAALKTLFQMDEQDYRKYWVNRVFHGEASAAPPELFSNGAAQDAVASIPGAVALVLASQVSSRVKVLKVDGHLPGEVGYPLQ